MPNFKIDTGMIRRFKAYYHASLFTDNVAEVNESKHIYLKDKSLLTKIKDRNLLNAWVDIIATYCKDIYNNKIIPQPASFKYATDLVVNTNDFIQDFVDENLTITKNDKDRLEKNEMKALFDSKNPTKHLSIQQLITNLREKGIEYNFNYRKNSNKGCFLGVTFKEVDDKPIAVETPYLFNDPLENGIDKTDMAVPMPIDDDMTSRLKKFFEEANVLHDLMKKTCADFNAI